MTKQKYIKVIVDDNAPTLEEICEKQKKRREEYDEEIRMVMAISIRRQYDEWQRVRAEHPFNTLDYVDFY